MAGDLERWLKGAPVLARPVGWLTRLARWGRRNPQIAGLLGATFLLLLLLLAGAVWEWVRTVQQWNETLA